MAIRLTKLTDSSILPNGVDIKGPVACMDCGFEGDIPQEWFLIDPPIKNKKDLSEASKTLQKQEGYKHFDNTIWQKGKLASASRCPECGSECLEEDY